MSAFRTVKITGERVTSPAAGFNPTWQRHVAAYALTARFLRDGPVLDLGCGVGHSYKLLGPHPSIGIDLDFLSLKDQGRPTVRADMRCLPVRSSTFGGLVAVQAIEHVPDPHTVLAESARVLNTTGVAVFATPNRLTFGRPDEIIDPYHFIEYDADELATLCRASFADVEMWGLFGSPRYITIHDEDRRRLEMLLRYDPLRLRRSVPRYLRQRAYDYLLGRFRSRASERANVIAVEDFMIGHEGLQESLDVIAVCKQPRHDQLNRLHLEAMKP